MKVNITVTARGPVRPPDLRAATLRATRRATALVYARTVTLVSGPLVQRRTGRLVRAMTQRVEERKAGAIGIVGVDNRAFYALFLDQGAQPHELGKGARTQRQRTPRRRGQRARGPFAGRRAAVMRFFVGGQTLFRYRARHPGLRGRHFMLAAVDQARPEIQRIFTQETEQEVARAV